MSFPILYSKNTTDFSNLGLGILADAIDVKITEELNGAFELDMVYLARGILHEQLVYDAIIKTDTGDQSGQLFRIKKITKTIDKRLNIHAEHVSYVMNDYPVSVSTIVSNATAQTALNAWKSSIESVTGSSSGLTVYSDITTANDAKWTIDTFNNARDVLGGVEGSILDTWGGEFKFDNYRINLLKQRGTTRDTIIAYGRNLTDLQQDESILETYTSVYPFATVNVKGAKNKADYTVIKTLPEKYVDSSYVNNYPMRRFLAVDFSDKFDDDKNKYSDASLRSLAQKYITTNKIGIPDVSITASVVDLEKAMNGGGSVERIDLGDVVQLNFTDVGINTSVEIVGTIYDVLRERYSEYTLGARKRTFSSIITGQINDVKKSVTRAQSDVISALISADGKSTNYYGSAEPTSPQEGDQWFWQDGPNSGIKQWHDGAWVDLVDTNTQAEIANSVTQAVAKAQSMDADLNQSINDSINETMTTVNNSLAALDSEAASFKSEADAATSSVASSVSALMTTTTASLAEQGSNAVSTANQALASASSVAVSAAAANSTANSNATKALSQASSTATSVAAAASIANSNATKAVTSAGTAITNANTALSSASSALSTANASSLVASSVASDVTGLKASYTSLNSSADVLSSQTASLAVSASSASAQFDKVSSTTNSLATETAALKVSASSASAEFTKVNSSATSLAADTASLKVSASSAAIGISSVASSAGSLSAQTASLAVSASSFATNITSLASENGSQATNISSLKQRADGFDLTVSKVDNLSVGGRNYVRYSSGLNGSSTVRPTLIGGSSGSNVTVTYPSDGILMTNGATNTTTEWYYQVANAWANFSATPLVPGQQYTFSADVMGTAPQAVLRYGFNGGTGGKEGSKNFDINNTSWTRISLTVVSTATNTGLYFRIQGGINNQYAKGWTGGETLKFRYVKIEDGNTPTAWSPAPEDIDAVTGSLASDTASLKLSASSAALDISHVASSAGSLAADTASLKVSASSAALSISSTQSTASSTATQAASLAVSASSAAIAISNVQSSAGSLSAETSSLKLSASSAALSIGNVQSSAGSLATETAALKVSASSASAQFDKVNSSAGSLATQAASLAVSASSAAIGISNVTSSAGSLAAQTASLAVSASSFSTSITSMSSQNGSQATAISALTQRADGFDLTVSKVDGITAGIGGTNLLLKSKDPWSSFGNNTATTSTKVTFDSTTQMLHITSPAGGSSNAGIYFGQSGKLSKTIVKGDKWAMSLDIKGSGVYSQFGLEGSINWTKPSGSIPSDWTRVSSTGTANGTNAVIMYFNSTVTALDVYIKLPKIELGTIPTEWSPAPEDIDAQFATQKITIDGITSTVSKQTSDINAVTTRVQTAEGSISTAQNNITGLQSSQTQTASQLQTEITDRNNGDSNTLTQAKSFTTSQIATYDTGIQSQFTQTSNAILGKISSTNLFPNSEFTKNYGYRTLNGTSVLSLGGKNNIDGKYNGVVSVASTSASYQGYWARNIPVYGGKKYSASVLVHYTNGGLTNGQGLLDIWFIDKDGARISTPNNNTTNTTSQVSSPYWVKLYMEGFVAPVNAVNMQVSLLVNGAGAGQYATFTQPMVTATEKLQEYSPNDDISAQLSLMTDNYSFGINANGQLVSGISGNEELLTLTGKTIHLTGETTVDGDFYAKGGNFKNLNASEIKTGTINASLINVINLNANNITTGTLNSNNVAIVGTNTSIDLSDGGLTISETSKPSAILHTYLETGQLRFEMRESTNIKTVGGLTTMANTSDTTANGIGLFLEQYNKSSYSNAGGDELYLSKSRSDGNYDFGYVWSAGGKVRNTGHHFYDRVYFEGNDLNFSGSKVYINGAYQPLLFTWISWSDLGDTKYPALGDDDQQVGIAFGSGTLYIYSPNGRKSWGQL